VFRIAGNVTDVAQLAEHAKEMYAAAAIYPTEEDNAVVPNIKFECPEIDCVLHDMDRGKDGANFKRELELQKTLAESTNSKTFRC
jgi:hypothetical protein